MPEFVVPAESRSETGKNVNRRLRSRGLIPGVAYGTGKDAVAVAVSPRELGAILKSASGENTLFDLDLGSTRRKVMGWTLRRAMPVKFKAADLNARGTDVGVEELHIVHEGLEHSA